MQIYISYNQHGLCAPVLNPLGLNNLRRLLRNVLRRNEMWIWLVNENDRGYLRRTGMSNMLDIFCHALFIHIMRIIVRNGVLADAVNNAIGAERQLTLDGWIVASHDFITDFPSASHNHITHAFRTSCPNILIAINISDPHVLCLYLY